MKQESSIQANSLEAYRGEGSPMEGRMKGNSLPIMRTSLQSFKCHLNVEAIVSRVVLCPPIHIKINSLLNAFRAESADFALISTNCTELYHHYHYHCQYLTFEPRLLAIT